MSLEQGSERHAAVTHETAQTGVAPEILVTRRWIEQEVIGKNTCPPLKMVIKPFRTDDGGIDWDGMSDTVQLTSFRHLPAGSDDLPVEVGNSYYSFIDLATKKKAPATVLYILPDFASNSDYIAFVSRMEKYTRGQLVSTPQGNDVIRGVVPPYARMNRFPDEVIPHLIEGSSMEELFMRAVRPSFTPTLFFREELTQDDQKALPKTGERKDRQNMLSRAPYYLLQLVDTLGTHDLVVNMNMDINRLRARNTRVATKALAGNYGQVMQTLRGQ